MPKKDSRPGGLPTSVPLTKALNARSFYPIPWIQDNALRTLCGVGSQEKNGSDGTEAQGVYQLLAFTSESSKEILVNFQRFENLFKELSVRFYSRRFGAVTLDIENSLFECLQVILFELKPLDHYSMD